MKRLRVLATITVALLVGLTGSATAESVDQVATALRGNPVFQQSGLDLVDGPAVADRLGGDPQVYVAVLDATAAASAAQAEDRAKAIGRQLGVSDAVVLVITANKHLGTGEGSGAAAKGVNAGRAFQQTPHAGGFDKASLTTFVRSFADTIHNQVRSRGSGGTVAAPSRDGSSNGGSSHTGVILLTFLAVVALAAVLFSRRSKRTRTTRENNGLRADVESLYNRLGSDVSTLDAKGDPVANQALADAAERYNATGSALATAASPAEFAAARRTAVEGLTAARTARTKLGLDPGPDIPLPAGNGPQLTGAQQVQFQDQQYAGSPNYQPGYQHYYGGGMLGGQMVPGGWYSQPFWTPFLLGGMLSGGFGGGGLFGGGYGGGYGGGGFERGYEEGREDSRGDGGQGGGGDWGGGGGDTGGGGDWGGGGGGGGDWGGGGGDSGGGGDW